MESGEPWHQLSALNTDTQRAQVYEKPLVSGFHGVSTDTLFFGPHPIPNQHSIDSWSHILPIPCSEDHSHSPKSWHFEHMPGASKNQKLNPEHKRKGGRPKGKTLSDEKKRTTRAVRQAGSCWPCYLRKIKVPAIIACLFAHELTITVFRGITMHGMPKIRGYS